jgi:hypothetical protein
VYFVLSDLDSHAKIDGGIVLGVSHNSINANYENGNSIGVEGKFGYSAGISLNYLISNRYFINPIFRFESRGFTQSFNSNGVRADFDLCADYLDVPILAGMKVSEKHFEILVFTGPYLKYGVIGNIKVEVDDGNTKSKYKEDIRWKVSKIDTSGLSLAHQYLIQSKYANLERINYGVAWGGGFGFRKFEILLTFSKGLGVMLNQYAAGEELNYKGAELIIKWNFLGR